MPASQLPLYEGVAGGEKRGTTRYFSNRARIASLVADVSYDVGDRDALERALDELGSARQALLEAGRNMQAARLASEAGAKRHNLEPKARILGMAVAGVPPRVMGIGPVPATNKLLERLNLTLDDFDVLELN